MDYQKALLYLRGFTNYEKFSNYNYRKAHTLDRVEKLLGFFDNPQAKYPSIIIGGTKGKGSTANMLASILAESGFKTGVFISPHLISARERIRIGQRPISKKEFSATLSLIKKAIDKNRLKGLTFFEILTALAFLYFAKKRIDIAVLEVGLGGRLDATNAAPSKITAITPISYDHTRLLGKTIEKIAYEKSGIIKESSYVISAPQPKEALKVIKRAARCKRAKLLIGGRDIVYKNLRVSLLGTRFDVVTPSSYYKNIKTRLIGKHQAINALTAIGIIETLKEHLGFDIKDKGIIKGFKQARVPGRFQIISKKPYIVLDGAQNRASAEALKDTFCRIFNKNPLLILGISSDKDIEAIGEVLCPLAKEVIFTKADSPRALEPLNLAQRLGKFCRDYYVAYDSKDAFKFAKSLTAQEGVILVTGSLFLVGEALKLKTNTKFKILNSK